MSYSLTVFAYNETIGELSISSLFGKYERRRTLNNGIQTLEGKDDDPSQT